MFGNYCGIGEGRGNPSFNELEWARKIASEMRWKGEFVVLPVERTPSHLLNPGNAAQYWTASSVRIRLAVEIEVFVRRDEPV